MPVSYIQTTKKLNSSTIRLFETSKFDVHNLGHIIICPINQQKTIFLYGDIQVKAWIWITEQSRCI